MSDPDLEQVPAGSTSDQATAAASGDPTLPPPVPHAGARYTVLRLLMLLAVGGVLYVVGLRGWLLAFLAVLVSGVVSLFLFMKQRNDAAVNLEHAVDNWKQHHGNQDDEGHEH